MGGEDQEFLSNDEVKEVLGREPEEIEEVLENEEFGKYALEKLIRFEKKQEGRDKVLNNLSSFLAHSKITERLNDLSEHLDETGKILEKVDISEKNEEDLPEPQEMTVNEVKDYVNENYLSSTQLHTLLEKEKAGKSRKTARKYLERNINPDKAVSNLEELQGDIRDLEEDINQLKKEFWSERKEFNFENVVNEHRPRDSDDNRRKKLIEITNDVIKKLKEENQLRDNEKLKELVNEAFLALEADNYETFEEKMRDTINLESSSDGEASEQEKKLEKMKKMVNKLEERQTENLDVPEDAKSELHTAEEKAEEQERHETIMEESKHEGFDKSEPKIKTYEGLRKPKNPSNKKKNALTGKDTADEIEKNLRELRESIELHEDEDERQGHESIKAFERKLLGNS